MFEKIMLEILEESKVSCEDVGWLKCVVEKTYHTTERINLCIETARWLAIGVHLAGAIKRARNEEKLPEIDPSIVKQIRPEMQALSSEILSSIQGIGTGITSLPEVILLAVHLQCAQDGF